MLLWQLILLNRTKAGLNSTHLYLSQAFLSLFSNLVLHFFIYGPNDLIMFTLSSKTEQIEVNEWIYKTWHNLNTSKLGIIYVYCVQYAVGGNWTCVELVPDCLSLWLSPVSGTLRGRGHLRGHSAALVCLSGVHTTESRAPADWHTTHNWLRIPSVNPTMSLICMTKRRWV